MDAEQKKRILKRFLREISANQQVVISDAQLAPYKDLGDALDLLEVRGAGSIDFTTVEANGPAWNELKDILMRGAKFGAGSPPAFESVSFDTVLNRMEFWRRDHTLNALPQSDYYNRVTQTQASDELEGLKDSARARIIPLLQSFMRAGVAFDATDNEQVNTLITQLKERMKSQPEGSPGYENDKKRLALAEDLNKINQLSLIRVPNETGGFNNFCSLAESAGGVTEKVSLVSMDTVRTQLGNLRDALPVSVDAYNASRRDYKLGTEAIIKLPKHGKIEEVQREAMALNVSRMLGLDTARSTTLMHNGQPAMFIPFDNIKLMKDFAKGKTFNAFASKQTYEHYSTINPVGEGLHGDQFVDDFGPAMGLFYLCSDTDAVGGYNQNKALRDGRSLFIFDQVIMSKDKLGLDSRLSMQPTEFLVKHTRHGQGRNRTLIEDSSLSSKFDSLMLLQERRNLICQYADKVAYQHGVREREIQQRLRERDLPDRVRKELTSELKQVQALKADANTMFKTMSERIAKINSILPTYNPQHISKAELKQTLILEKLMHNPVMFTSEGRPYKNPWTQRQNNPIKSIVAIDGGRVAINFESKVSDDMINFLKRQGAGDSLAKSGSKQVVISRAQLAALNERMLHPESQAQFNPATPYLDPRDLAIISKAYDEGHRGRILRSIDNYSRIMASPHVATHDKLEAMVSTENAIKDYISTAKDKGFGTHVLKKLQFDMQQKLQAMIPGHQMPAQLTAAFEAAVKLDRAGEFNQVLREAISRNRVNNPEFLDFLNQCVQKGAAPTNHMEATQRSKEVSDLAGDVLLKLKAPTPLVVEEHQHEDEEIVILDESDLMEVNVFEIRESELESQATRLQTVREETAKVDTGLKQDADAEQTVQKTISVSS